jgi:hypothetical protein
MAFDTNSPTPKILFSPAGKVPDEDLPTIGKQAKSAVAEMAIKMNVFQMDTEVAVHEPVEEVAESVEEPVKRPSTKVAAEEKDISSVVKKWSKK